MKYRKIDLNIFPKEREKKMQSIYRYSMFDVMLYRSNLWMHSHRVLWLVEDAGQVVKKYISHFDIERARLLALFHDDAEMIIGDIQAGSKAKMSEKKLQAIEEQEIKAIKILAKKFPKYVNEYLYQDLLIDMVRKDSVEAKLVSYMDKFDGFCESLHEVFAGNVSLLRSVLFYNRWFMTVPFKKFPEIIEFIASRKLPSLSLDERGLSDHVYKKACLKLTPYNKRTILKDTDILFYNYWKKIVLKKGGKEGLGWLIKQKEFIK